MGDCCSYHAFSPFLHALRLGNTFTNHWNAPTYLVNIEDSSLRGGGTQLKKSIVDGTRRAMEEWSGGEELTECSLYGIRIYTEEAMLNSHVDRLPQVFSAGTVACILESCLFILLEIVAFLYRTNTFPLQSFIISTSHQCRTRPRPIMAHGSDRTRWKSL
jgi:hypothetical protein